MEGSITHNKHYKKLGLMLLRGGQVNQRRSGLFAPVLGDHFDRFSQGKRETGTTKGFA